MKATEILDCSIVLFYWAILTPTCPFRRRCVGETDARRCLRVRRIGDVLPADAHNVCPSDWISARQQSGFPLRDQVLHPADLHFDWKFPPQEPPGRDAWSDVRTERRFKKGSNGAEAQGIKDRRTEIRDESEVRTNLGLLEILFLHAKYCSTNTACTSSLDLKWVLAWWRFYLVYVALEPHSVQL